MSSWIEINNSLERTYTFKTFAEALAWMMMVSLEIEKADHHPEWTNIYNKVSVTLRTHSAGNKVTDKDRKLAAVMDEIYGRFRSN